MAKKLFSLRADHPLLDEFRTSTGYFDVRSVKFCEWMDAKYPGSYTTVPHSTWTFDGFYFQFTLIFNDDKQLAEFILRYI